MLVRLSPFNLSLWPTRRFRWLPETKAALSGQRWTGSLWWGRWLIVATCYFARDGWLWFYAGRDETCGPEAWRCDLLLLPTPSATPCGTETRAGFRLSMTVRRFIFWRWAGQGPWPYHVRFRASSDARAIAEHYAAQGGL